MFVLELLFILFRTAWLPSVGKVLSYRLSIHAVLLYAVLIVCVPFLFGVLGRTWNSIVSVPFFSSTITKLEAVQRRSARWATRDHQRTSSVTQMIKDLNWRTLEQRRIDSRLTLMYKITYDLVAIPAADYLIPNTRRQDTTTYELTGKSQLSKTITSIHFFPAP